MTMSICMHGEFIAHSNKLLYVVHKVQTPGTTRHTHSSHTQTHCDCDYDWSYNFGVSALVLVRLVWHKSDCMSNNLMAKLEQIGGRCEYVGGGCNSNSNKSRIRNACVVLLLIQFTLNCMPMRHTRHIRHTRHTFPYSNPFFVCVFFFLCLSSLNRCVHSRASHGHFDFTVSFLHFIITFMALVGLPLPLAFEINILVFFMTDPNFPWTRTKIMIIIINKLRYITLYANQHMEYGVASMPFPFDIVQPEWVCVYADCGLIFSKSLQKYVTHLGLVISVKCESRADDGTIFQTNVFRRTCFHFSSRPKIK